MPLHTYVIHETRYCYKSYATKTVTKLQGPTLILGLAYGPAHFRILVRMTTNVSDCPSITVILHNSPLRASLV